MNTSRILASGVSLLSRLDLFTSYRYLLDPQVYLVVLALITSYPARSTLDWLFALFLLLDH
jgi:hypothetical protein